MKQHPLRLNFFVMGGIMAVAMVGTSTPVFAAGSATLQGDLIAAGTGIIQFDTIPGGSQAVSGYSLALPASAHSEDGSFVSAWSSSIYDNSAENVYAHRFNADGSSAGSDILVNQTLAAQGSLVRYEYPKVAADGSGNFAVAWKALAANGQSAILKARLFSADGSPRGDEFCVDPSCVPVPVSVAHAVAMQANGTITVAYVGNFINNGSPLYFRQFAPDGTALSAQAVEVYGNVTAFSMALVRGSGLLSFALYTNQTIGTLGGGYQYTSVHLRRYYANGNPLGLPVTLGSCSAIYFGVSYGCEVIKPFVGSDTAGNLTVSWIKNTFSGATQKTQTYLRHYYANGFAKGPRVTVDPNSMLALGISAEDGAGDLIAGGPTGDDGLQVFDNQGNPLGDIVPSPAGFDISTDNSRNFVATHLLTTFPPSQTMTTVAVQRYSVP